MNDYERELIESLKEANGLLEGELRLERAEYDELKSLVVCMMNEMRKHERKPSEILDDFSDALEQYCSIYIDEELKKNG